MTLGHHATGKVPAIKVFLDLAEYQVARSVKLLRAGKVKQAKEEMLEIAKLDPLGLIQLSRQNLADLFFDEKKPQNLYRVLNDIGYIFEQADEPRLALPYLEWVQARIPSRTVVYLNLFDTYSKL